MDMCLCTTHRQLQVLFGPLICNNRHISAGKDMHQEAGQSGEQEEVTGLVCQESELQDGQ